MPTQHQNNCETDARACLALSIFRTRTLVSASASIEINAHCRMFQCFGNKIAMHVNNVNHVTSKKPSQSIPTVWSRSWSIPLFTKNWSAKNRHAFYLKLTQTDTGLDEILVHLPLFTKQVCQKPTRFLFENCTRKNRFGPHPGQPNFSPKIGLPKNDTLST